MVGWTIRDLGHEYEPRMVVRTKDNPHPASLPPIKVYVPPPDETGPRVTVVAGSLGHPINTSGQYALTVRADGSAMLEHLARGSDPRVWTAQLSPLVWPRLLHELQQASFPANPQIAGPPGSRGTSIAVHEAEPSGFVTLDADQSHRWPMGPATLLLESLVYQVSNGELRMTRNRMPLLAHQPTAQACWRLTGPAPGPYYGATRSVAFGTAGGARVYAVASDREGLRLYDVQTRNLVRADDEAQLRRAAMGIITSGRDDDGQPLELLVTADTQHGLASSDAATGKLRASRSATAGPVRAVAAGAGRDFSLTLAATSLGTLASWTSHQGQEFPSSGRRAGALNTAAYCRIGETELLAFGGDDDEVCLARAADGEILRVLPGHGGWVEAIAFDERMSLLATAGADDVVRVWRLDAPQAPPLTLTAGQPGITRLAFVTFFDRTLLAALALDGTVSTWDVLTGQLSHSWTGVPTAPVEQEPGWPTGSAWPTGLATLEIGGRQTLVTSDTSGMVRLFDAATGEPTATWQLLFRYGRPHISALAATEVDGRPVLALGTPAGNVSLHDAVDGAVRWEHSGAREPHGPVTALAFGYASQAPVLIVGDARGAVRQLQLADGQERLVFTGHFADVLSMILADDAELLVTGSRDGTLRTWRSRTLWPVQRWEAHSGGVTTLATRTVGPQLWVVSGGHDRRVRIWEGRTGKLLREFSAYSNAVDAVAIGVWATESALAVADGSGVIMVYNIRTTAQIAFVKHEQPERVCDVALHRYDSIDTLLVATRTRLLHWRLPASPNEPAELLQTEELSTPPLAIEVATGAMVHVVTADGLRTIRLHLGQGSGHPALEGL